MSDESQDFSRRTRQRSRVVKALLKLCEKGQVGQQDSINICLVLPELPYPVGELPHRATLLSLPREKVL